MSMEKGGEEEEEDDDDGLLRVIMLRNKRLAGSPRIIGLRRFVRSVVYSGKVRSYGSLDSCCVRRRLPVVISKSYSQAPVSRNPISLKY